MPAVVDNRTMTFLGTTFNYLVSTTADNAVIAEPILAAAQTGTLSVRSSGTAGTITMSDGGHTITTAAKIDIYSLVAGVGTVSYNATVGTVSGTTVPFTLANGDALPAATSAVTVMIPHVETFPVTAANCVVLAVQAAGAVPCLARFRDVSVADIGVMVARTGSDLSPWVSGVNGTGPLGSTDSVTVMVTHGSTSSRKVMVYAAAN